MSIQVFIFALIASCAAGNNLCKASEATNDLEMLGDSLTDLETAPLGAQVRAEGRLKSDELVRNRATNKQCVAYYLEVTLVSTTTDSEGDTDYHYYRAFEEVVGPRHLVIKSGGIKLAVPLGFWTRYHKTQNWETGSWPDWLSDQPRISGYRGRFREYQIETVCLPPGQIMFVAGSVASVVEEGSLDQAEAADDSPLSEINNPLITLRPSPAFGPIDVWPGTELERIGDLRDYRRRKRIYGGLLTGLAALLALVGVYFVKIDF